ncbi:high frequency lysogenization protein HflD [Alteromonas sp. 5E99-2]|uniref:high frequency lysogenization protein HflD n=1 Tax=Alteromonas sp. 5E99-2 TaxID=2817683 RepID=UPI001A987ACB|nr:high frequency lysogenization protein HflD [Alteromonas sp. 5E99-2]MBO1256241.1 high frequency lysogenization protein HflD [Alteromonas sp. 5E99-2]
MLTPAIERQLALAGVCQSAFLVKHLAKKGELDKLAFESSLSSILVTDPQTPQQVFGSLNNLKLGFQTLVSQLNNEPKNKDIEITRYVMAILTLERKLAKHKSAMSDLATRIAHVQRQLAYVEIENQQVQTSLASIYSDIVSPLAPKIQISGNAQILKTSINQHRVRSILLAGVRSAVMWRQMGGRRRQLLLQRKHIVDSAHQALRLIH